MSEIEPIDVVHLGCERVICCWRVDDVLIDPGPETALQTLLEALGSLRPRALLLTHIHFDHAGAAGALCRRFSDLEVHVHEVGAPHLADPERLVRSARRLYGDDFDRLWGEVAPVPRDRLRPLGVTEGERQVLGFRAADTPGHARHHACFLHEPTGQAFVGDTAGVRIPPAAYALAPTPPPDVDVEAWRRSLELLGAWGPDILGLTHFGAVTDVASHLAAVAGWLDEWVPVARELDAEEFADALHARIAAEVNDDTALVYERAAPADQVWQGLRRWWEKRKAAAG